MSQPSSRILSIITVLAKVFSNRIIRLVRKNKPGLMEASLVDQVANFFGCDQLEASKKRESQRVLLSPLHGFFKAFLLLFHSTDSSDVNSSWEQIKLQPSVSTKRNVTHILPSKLHQLHLRDFFFSSPPSSSSTCVTRLWKNIWPQDSNICQKTEEKCLTASCLHNVNLSPVCSHPYPHIYQPAAVCLCCFVFLFFPLPSLICRAFHCDEFRGCDESPSGGKFPFLLNHWTHVSPVWSLSCCCFGIFFPLQHTELKKDQETPSERMNNHFIEMLKACCVESFFFFHTFPEDQTFFYLI